MAGEQQEQFSKPIALFIEGMLGVIQNKLGVIQGEIEKLRVPKQKILKLTNAISTLSDEEASLLKRYNDLQPEYEEKIHGMHEEGSDQSETFYPVAGKIIEELRENEKKEFVKENGELRREIDRNTREKLKLEGEVSTLQKLIKSEFNTRYKACVKILKDRGLIELLQSLKLKGNTNSIGAINKALEEVIILLLILKNTNARNIVNVDNAPEIFIPISENLDLSETFLANSTSMGSISFYYFVDILKEKAKDLVKRLNSQYENIIWESIEQSFLEDPKMIPLIEGHDLDGEYQVLALEYIFGQIDQSFDDASNNGHLMPPDRLSRQLLEARALTKEAIVPILVFLFFIMAILACATGVGGAIYMLAYLNNYIAFSIASLIVDPIAIVILACIINVLVIEINDALKKGGHIRNNEKRNAELEYDEDQKKLPGLAAKARESLNANSVFNRHLRDLQIINTPH